MALLPKTLPGTVRDAFVQTIRRAPAQQQHGDSLRRFVLQRNAVLVSMDPSESLTKPTMSAPVRRFSTDIVPPSALTEESGLPRSAGAEMTLKRSRSVHSMSASNTDVAMETTDETKREDQWFDALFQDLYIEDDLAQHDLVA